jgi:large subunit ribosomal protein L10
VVKKKLLEKVLQNYQKNQWLEKIQDIKGPMALVLGFGEEIAPSKIIYDFAQKNEKLKILGGILTDSFLEKELVMELAKLPSKPELIARLLSSMQAPISNFVYVLNGNIKGLVTILSKIKS